jgi:hypothetical protein
MIEREKYSNELANLRAIIDESSINMEILRSKVKYFDECKFPQNKITRIFESLDVLYEDIKKKEKYLNLLESVPPSLIDNDDTLLNKSQILEQIYLNINEQFQLVKLLERYQDFVTTSHKIWFSEEFGQKIIFFMGILRYFSKR